MRRTFGLPQSTPEAGKSGCRLKGGVGEVWTAAMGRNKKNAGTSGIRNACVASMKIGVAKLNYSLRDIRNEVFWLLRRPHRPQRFR